MHWMRLVLVFLVASLVYAEKEEQEEETEKRERLKRFAICALRPAYGNCRGRRSLWTYNIYRQVCEQFTYSNCGGNPNRFHSDEQCMKFCKG
ncbi:kunitz-type serine protease inhibitor-like [Drosophila obscura]|uniref:kunitz-type serine protease inhibitor-like n=1 Tax=Drosophila obscura TaxID=7282 RepID=UPI000BA0509A|nr:kunitz-type serine protease inhibitor-like [Drosophila obscura]